MEFSRDRQEGPSVGFGTPDTKARAGRVGPDVDQVREGEVVDREVSHWAELEVRKTFGKQN